MDSKPELPIEQPAPAIIEENSEQLQSSGSSAREIKTDEIPVEEWKPSSRLYVAFLTLCVITLMVALDGTSLSVALPVCFMQKFELGIMLQRRPDHSYRSSQSSLMALQSKPSGPEPPSY